VKTFKSIIASILVLSVAVPAFAEEALMLKCLRLPRDELYCYRSNTSDLPAEQRAVVYDLEGQLDRLKTQQQRLYSRDPVITDALPELGLAEDADPISFLQAALTALHATDRRRAQEALEGAETRLLTRSVKIFTTKQPAEDRASLAVQGARRALVNGDLARCESLINDAMRAGWRS
jgi:hypothetical protein